MPKEKVPLDKREDFGLICAAATIFCSLSGMLNGIAFKEVGTAVGYTSGPCMNVGRLLGSGSPGVARIAGLCANYYAGGIMVGITGSDADSLFEGKMSFGLLFSAALIVLGTMAKRNFNNIGMAVQVWAFSQGLQNAITSRFSAAPIRSTHTAGGMTDAAIHLGQWMVAVNKGQVPAPLRKVIFNAVCVFTFMAGGFAAGKVHPKTGVLGALVPASVLAASATLPAILAPASTKDETEEKRAT